MNDRWPRLSEVGSWLQDPCPEVQNALGLTPRVAGASRGDDAAVLPGDTGIAARLANRALLTAATTCRVGTRALRTITTRDDQGRCNDEDAQDTREGVHGESP